MGVDGNLNRVKTSMLLVTGGAGFIGSNLVASLNEGSVDVAVSDTLGSAGKWRNLAGRQFADLIAPTDLQRWLEGRKLDAVVHLGGISSTAVIDGDRMIETNFRLPLHLLEWTTSTRTPFIYASSSATYGDGRAGYSDDWANGSLKRLRPMSLYGWSKHLFDLAVVERAARKDKLPPQWVGLKFFNVFGPNEYHKGEGMSLVASRFNDAKEGKPARLFKSSRKGIADGEQKRDFTYVDDVIAVIRWLIDTPTLSGIFNVGTGQARSFRELVTILFAVLGREPVIKYVDMPAAMRDSFQYYAVAEIENLRRAGYDANFMMLEEAVKHYVSYYLSRADRYR